MGAAVTRRFKSYASYEFCASSEVGPRAVIATHTGYGAATLRNASIEYFPAPVMCSSKKPPTMLRFL